MATLTRTTLLTRSTRLIPKHSSLYSRTFATTPSTQDASSSSSSETKDVPPLRLSREQRAALEEMIRVDQAGELGANWIYRGQYAVLGSDKKVGPLLEVGSRGVLNVKGGRGSIQHFDGTKSVE